MENDPSVVGEVSHEMLCRNILRQNWDHFYPFWGHLAQSRTILRSFWDVFWAILGLFWTVLVQVQFGTILGPPGAVLGPSMSIFGAFAASLGTM